MERFNRFADRRLPLLKSTAFAKITLNVLKETKHQVSRGLKHVESQQKTSMIRSHGPISWQDGLWGSRKGHLAGRLLLLKPHVKITQVTLGM